MPPKKTSEKRSQASAPLCKCYTNKGSRCSRKSVTTNGYCKQHSKKCSYKSEEEYKASQKKPSGRKKQSGKKDSKPQLLAIEDKKPAPNPADFKVSKKARLIGGGSVHDALEQLRKMK